MNAIAPIVHVVDDDVSFLAAISRLLRAAGFSVKTYLSAEEFLAQRDADSPGCVLSDLQMPQMSGLDLQTALAQTSNPLPILFLTGHGDILSTVQAMRDGAEDFLEKCAPKEKLLEAVIRALGRDAQERGARQRQRELHARFDTLTARELEVLSHVVRGRLNKQIASDLNIHERTVKLHRTAITTKLKVQSVAELTRLTQEANIFLGLPESALENAAPGPKQITQFPTGVPFHHDARSSSQTTEQRHAGDHSTHSAPRRVANH